MKKIGFFAPIFGHPQHRALLTAGLVGTLLLSGCGTSSNEAGSGEGTATVAPTSSVAEASAAKTPEASSASTGSVTASEEATDAEATSGDQQLGENFAGAGELAEATEVATDTAEVQKTEELYTNIQETLSTIEPVTTGGDVSAANEGSEEVASEEPIDPAEYVSDETVAQLEEVTTGAALDQYLATATEYSMSGWHVEGTSTVVGTPKMADGQYQGQEAKILEVCLDSSNVKVVDSQGATMSTSQFPRSLNIFTLIEENGEWKIASHDFPNNADC